MIIGLDLDNCIFDTESLYKQAFVNTEYRYTLPTSWKVVECYPKQIADYLCKIFKSKAIYYTPLLNEKLPYTINHLKNYIDIKVLSARYNEDFNAQKASYDQLQRNRIHIPLEDIIITKKSKINDIISNRIDIMFDDSPHIIKECLDNKVRCIMISNDRTLYNHYLRKYVENYTDLVYALNKVIQR